MGGIRAELTVASPPDCPVAEASAVGGTATSVRKSVPADPDAPVTEEFALDRSGTGPSVGSGRATESDRAVGPDPAAGPDPGAEPDRGSESARPNGSADGASLRTVFQHGDERVYRFDRPQRRTCFCECIEAFGCPVQTVRAENGRLTVAFYAPDEETLRAVVSRLDEGWSDVSVRRLLRSRGDAADGDLVLVDRSDLTDRQREVLETAHEMGYFEHPKRANATEVAAALDLHPSTVAEHLAAAQGKLLDAVLD